MANHQIIIDATDTNNQPVKKTITNINPAASNEQLATFGVMLNALTTNVYAGTTKITKTNCDTEPGGGEKPVPTLELYTPNKQELFTHYEKQASSGNLLLLLPLKYTGDGNIAFSSPIDSYGYINQNRDADNFYEVGLQTTGTPSAGNVFVFHIFSTETDNYAQAEWTFTFTFTA